MKFVVVTGGVVSGIGKGVTSSSIGVLLKACGYHVTAIKIDPYLNIDAGTFSPYEHGEVFVLDDGGECDLDLGNYERFMDITLSKDNNITTGKIYQKVMEAERRGDYLGKTVQIVPHVTNAIQEWITGVAEKPVNGQAAEVCIIELGGTIGDIESMPFVEALRQLQFRLGSENFVFVHVSLVPVLGSVGEPKTKPTQHSVRELRALGLSPDLIMCRSEKPIDKDTSEKLAMFCQVPPGNVISVHDVSNLYRVPLMLWQQGVQDVIIKKLQLARTGDVAVASNINANSVGAKGQVARTMMPTLLQDWKNLSDKVDSLTEAVNIAFVGKYVELKDSYHSVIKSLEHAAIAVSRKLVIKWIEAEHLEANVQRANPAEYESAWSTLKQCQGILVPGGFGERGIEGKILAAQYARTHNVPYLGLCLGFQIAVIEFARNVLGWESANTTEIDEKSGYPMIIYMPEISKTHMGGTMRLGSRRTIFKEPQSSIVAQLYGGAHHIDERHRHRYEVNIHYRAALEKKGMKFVGTDETEKRMEVLELEGHPYFVGVQFHPEFKTRPHRPSPPFVGLLEAATHQGLFAKHAETAAQEPVQQQVGSPNAKRAKVTTANGH